MADSTRPLEIPDLYKLKPNGVLAYVDGAYAWPSSIVKTFPRVWRISVTAELQWAAHARELDVERYDATPQDVEPFRAERERLTGRPTIVYCNRSTVPAVVAACHDWELLLWHIATLDGWPWTPQALVTDLESNWRVRLDPRAIAAIQNLPMGRYDSSRVFLADPMWSPG